MASPDTKNKTISAASARIGHTYLTPKGRPVEVTGREGGQVTLRNEHGAHINVPPTYPLREVEEDGQRDTGPDIPVGSFVLFRPIAGSPTIEATRTRSEPWQLGDGTWVVKVKGRSGGVSTAPEHLEVLDKLPPDYEPEVVMLYMSDDKPMTVSELHELCGLSSKDKTSRALAQLVSARMASKVKRGHYQRGLVHPREEPSYEPGEEGGPSTESTEPEKGWTPDRPLVDQVRQHLVKRLASESSARVIPPADSPILEDVPAGDDGSLPITEVLVMLPDLSDEELRGYLEQEPHTPKAMESADPWKGAEKTDERVTFVKGIASVEQLSRLEETEPQARVLREIERHRAALEKVAKAAEEGSLDKVAEGKRIQERPGAMALIASLRKPVEFDPVDPALPDVCPITGLPEKVAAGATAAVKTGDPLAEPTHECETEGCDGSGVDCRDPYDGPEGEDPDLDGEADPGFEARAAEVDATKAAVSESSDIPEHLQIAHQQFRTKVRALIGPELLDAEVIDQIRKVIEDRNIQVDTVKRLQGACDGFFRVLEGMFGERAKAWTSDQAAEHLERWFRQEVDPLLADLETALQGHGNADGAFVEGTYPARVHALARLARIALETIATPGEEDTVWKHAEGIDPQELADHLGALRDAAEKPAPTPQHVFILPGRSSRDWDLAQVSMDPSGGPSGPKVHVTLPPGFKIINAEDAELLDAIKKARAAAKEPASIQPLPRELPDLLQVLKAYKSAGLSVELKVKTI